MGKCGAVGLDGGVIAQGALGASVLAWGSRSRSCSCSCSRSWSPGGGKGVGSKVHENCRLWAACPPPPRATPRFCFRDSQGVKSFSFSFSCFPGFRLAKHRAYCPTLDCGELGPRATERGEARHFCVFDENKMFPPMQSARARGTGSQGKLCGAAARHCHCRMEKEKQSQGRKRKKNIHYRAPWT